MKTTELEEEKRVNISYFPQKSGHCYELSWVTFAGVYLSRKEVISLRDDINKLLEENK